MVQVGPQYGGGDCGAKATGGEAVHLIIEIS